MRSLLRPGGRLDILEQTKVNRPFTFLFGLLEGFWHFEDFDIRRDYCILEHDQWLETFETCGFQTVRSTRMLNDHHTYFSLRKCQREGSAKVKSVKGQSNNKLWLIFHLPGNKISEYLKDKISDLANRKVILVHSGKQRPLVVDPNDNESVSTVSVRPDFEQDFVEMMKIFGGKMLEGIIYCWTLDPEVTDQDELLQPYFYLLKNMYKGGAGCNPRLITLTCGATNPGQDCALGNIHASTVLGVTKSFRNERTEFQGKCLDICVEGDGGIESEEIRLQVFYEIWKLGPDSQLSFRSGHSYVPKLVALKPNLQGLSMPCGTDRFQLTLPETKSIHDLKFAPLEPFGPLGNLEVEVQIKASALNFKDVLNVIKPTDEFKSSNSVGFDYAGVIKRVGSKVNRWSVGDRVFGVNYNGTPLPSHTKQNQDNVIPVPDSVTFCEAATLPAVFSTAYHCLVDLVKITRNDTVLIHAASGGVGLVAIQICKNIGCSIICTAGSHRKQNFLRRNLGIQNVFHSRNTEFQDKIMEVTQGHGVTVVLNSLTSEGFKEASLKCCAKGARFIEMSKLNIWTTHEVRDLRPDVFYSVVDLTTLEQPDATRLLKTLSKMLTEKEIDPIPSVKFDAVRIREALQYLQKAKHIGKVMVMMPEMKQSKYKSEIMTPLFNKESTYLITGGLGGIGFEVCKWMVQRQGARWVILAGRRSPDTKLLQEIEELNKTEGSKVMCVQLDVSDFEQCKDLLESKIPEMGAPPLRGIMHCAGTLHDGLIENQDWSGFSSTFSTKVKGTLNLHQLTFNLKLDYFVLFSSMAANFGSPGQGNHTAGNLFEDTIAHYRHSLGLPATSINWGQWGEVGIATEVEIPGIRPISNEQGLQGLEYCLRSQRLQTMVVNVESFVVLNKLNRYVGNYLDEQIWKAMTSGKSLQSSSGIKSDEFWRLYDAISEKQNQNDDDDRSEKLEFVQGQLKHILREILKLEENDVIEDDSNFHEMGVDSLMFVELKNSLQTLFSDRVTVNASAVRDCDTVRKLTSQLVAMIEGDDISSENSGAPTPEEVAALIREDAQLPENIRAKEGSRTVDVQNIKVVMLTGVTGTLGPYILKELTSVSHQVTKVICLIRPQRSFSSEDRLRNVLQQRNLLSEVDMSKVTVISGNIASPHLGLDDLQWQEVIDEVDAVFHCAAMVQHVDYYRKARTDMRSVNVGGTKNILEFCSSGSKVKRLLHASTLFAIGTTNARGCLSEDWPEVGDFDGVTALSYSNTKFVADNLVKQAVTERGVPAKIFRFPLIFGDSRSGRFVLENNHAMLRYLFIMKTGVMPSNPFPMVLLPVDLCASIAVKIFFDERFPDRIYNICHDTPPLDQEFVDVAKKLGYHVEVVEFSEFGKKVTESTEEDSPFALFKEFYRDEKNLMSLYTTAPAVRHWSEMGHGDEQSQDFFVSAKIKEILPEFYGDLEPAMEYVLRDLRFAQNNGWLKKFGL